MLWGIASSSIVKEETYCLWGIASSSIVKEETYCLWGIVSSSIVKEETYCFWKFTFREIFLGNFFWGKLFTNYRGKKFIAS